MRNISLDGHWGEGPTIEGQNLRCDGGGGGGGLEGDDPKSWPPSLNSYYEYVRKDVCRRRHKGKRKRKPEITFEINR